MSSRPRRDHPTTASIDNRLIAVLPRAGRTRLIAAGKLVRLVPAEVLCERSMRIRAVYFPVDGSIADVATADGCAVMGVRLVGNEGMCGVALALGVDTSTTRTVVQGEGSALRVGAAAFRRELQRNPTLRRVLNRYAFVLLAQIAQTAGCIGLHVVEQRLARWLLMSHDRAHTDTFSVTHLFLAAMLGVRRAGVTQAAGALQRRHLIRYTRGRVHIVSRRGLEAAACRCYRTDRETWQRLLG
ncbi:MAG TPA: Crp/Fnr family transcriptional regulator [Rhodanobacteraceae bacterium]